MRKNLVIAYLIALFPLTGILGMHHLYLSNLKKFFIRLLACFTVIGGIIFWIYDLVVLPKYVNEANNRTEDKINQIVELLDQGKLSTALKMFIKTGETQKYVREIIRRGHGDVIVKHFAETDQDRRNLERLISNGDTESLVVHLSKYYMNTQLNKFLNI